MLPGPGEAEFKPKLYLPTTWYLYIYKLQIKDACPRLVALS